MILQKDDEENKDGEDKAEEMKDGKDLMSAKRSETVVIVQEEKRYSVLSVRAIDKSAELRCEEEALMRHIAFLQNQEGFTCYYGVLTNLKTIKFVRYSKPSFSWSEQFDTNVDDYVLDVSPMKEVYMLIAAIVLKTLKTFIMQNEMLLNQ